ncbi:YhdP family protein [Aliikangiella coralliicola]|uniref:YhdP central domain-containing protein n=1 Tax=Aliikangiella coralliicola TaxID=2592383 RepID=A0A545UB21_9GAMM|nr:DUF3971 domain-containing protein [Aliikangiella coralliicola]TQV86666.1 hypothetical protein FLL46_17385 [Aliikangiella coralliicola]
MNNQTYNPVARFFVYLVNKMWLLLATLIILTAVIFTLLRVFLPQINYFKQDIESWLENEFQVEIDIESIDAEWGASGPVFSAKNFQLKSSDGQLSVISVEALSIYLDGFGSLLSNQFVSENIAISGASLNFVIDRKLGVRFDALEEMESEQLPTEFQSTSKVLLSTLFGQKHLIVSDSKITLETLTGKQFNYNIEQLNIQNYEHIHQLTGFFDDEKSGKLKLAAEIYGDPSSDDSYTHFYLEGRGIDLSKLPVSESHQHLKPDSGVLNWRLWSDWKDNRWQTAVGDIQIEQMEWNENEQLAKDNNAGIKTSLANIENFTAKFSWNFNDENSGLFSLSNIDLTQKKVPLDNNQDDHELDNTNKLEGLPNIYLVYQNGEQNIISWDVIIHNFEVSPLNSYFDLLLGEAPKSTFSSSDFKLNLDVLGVRLTKENRHWLKPVFHTQFSKLHYQSLLDLPQANGLSGEINIVDGLGRAKLAGSDIKLYFNGLFRAPLALDTLDVNLNWLIDSEDNLDLYIDSAAAKNEDLGINAKARFFFQDDKPVLSLFAELNDVNAENKSLYLPVAIMDDALVEYLDNGVKSGRLPLVKAVVHGPLDAFPFDNQEGLFSILGFLENSTFAYQPDWPQVEGLKAKLLFEGNGMDLRATAGATGKNQVNRARAVIKDYSALNTPFELYLDVASQDNAGSQFLQQTPLKELGENLEVFEITGPLRTKVDLSFGLDDSSNLTMQGQVFPDKKKTKIKVKEIKLEDVEGVVNFNHLGGTASQLKAKYHGSPIDIQIAGPDKTEKSELTVSVQGKIKSEALSDFAGKTWAQFIAGEANFSSEIKIAADDSDSDTQISFNTDLKGIEINLPDEFAKSKAQVTPLTLNINAAEISTATIQWEKFLGKWQWQEKSKNTVEQLGGIFLFNSEKTMPQTVQPEFTVDGRLARFDLKEWQPVIEKIKRDYQSLSEKEQASPEKVLSPKNNTSKQQSRIGIKLHVDEIINPAVALNNVDIAAHQSANGSWVFGVHSELGNLLLRDKGKAPWELEINDLNLHLKTEFLAEDADESEKSGEVTDGKSHSKNDSASAIESLASWHDIDIKCFNCTVVEKVLGSVDANLRVKDNKLTLAGKIIDGKRHNLSFKLHWSQTEEQLSELENELLEEAGERETKVAKNTKGESQSNKAVSQLVNHTLVEYELFSDNVGAMMKRFDYPVGVEDSSGRFIGRLWWNDLPWSIEPVEIEGDSRVELGKGYLSDISDAKARLFSLFNLQSLSRKLQLDFKDVYKKGFFYDKLYGDVSLREGVVFTDNIYVDGNAAKVDLKGSVDLNEDTIEQYALVTPQLTSSLPVLVGWAVEPTTGLLVYLINKIMEPAIEVVTQIEYRIHGPLEQIKVDEIKKQKSKVKYDVPEPEPESEPKSQLSGNEGTEKDVTSDNDLKSEVEASTEIKPEEKNEVNNDESGN